MRAVIHQGQAVITHVLHPGTAKSEHELVRRLDRHLAVRAAVEQQQRRRLGADLVQRRRLLVEGGPLTLRGAAPCPVSALDAYASGPAASRTVPSNIGAFAGAMRPQQRRPLLHVAANRGTIGLRRIMRGSSDAGSILDSTAAFRGKDDPRTRWIRRKAGDGSSRSGISRESFAAS
jgi:hypothetical protein